MAGGIKLARKLLLGQETTPGTAVAASTYWRGMGLIDDQREIVQPEEHVGIISGTTRTYQPKYSAAVSMDAVEATFEQMDHILQASIKTAVATQDGTGSGYERLYAAPTGALDVSNLTTYTLEGGNNQQAEEIEYSFVDSWELSGKVGEALMVSGEWLGRQVTKCSFTGTATIPEVEEILFSKGKLYIDEVSGTIGTTQIENAWLEATVSYKSGWRPVFTGEGNLYFTFAKQVGPEVTIDLKLEHDASGVGQKDAFVAGTPKLIRMLWEGSALETAGTGYTYKTFQIDAAGFYEKAGPLEDDEGDDVLPLSFKVAYDSTGALFFEVLTVNENSAIP